MEKPSRSKGTIVLKYLQKAATFSITNHPHSPRGAGAGEKRTTARGYSGPIAPIFPAGARYNKKSDREAVDEEPTSPKVTCIGQIKHKKKASEEKERQKKKAPSGVTRTFSQRVGPSGEKEKEKEKEKNKRPPLPELAVSTASAAAPPALGQMRKFASGRETLSGFDWEKVAAEENFVDEKGKEGGGEKMNIYHSAPLVLGGGASATATAAAGDWKEKKMGLWRRRAMAGPIAVNVGSIK